MVNRPRKMREKTPEQPTKQLSRSTPLMVPIRTNTVSKVQVAAPKSKGNQGKRGRKVFNDTHLQYPSPQKRWRSKVIEANQTTIKIEDKTTLAYLFAGTVDSPASASRTVRTHRGSSNPRVRTIRASPGSLQRHASTYG
jgi:hypothetical protein